MAWPGPSKPRRDHRGECWESCDCVADQETLQGCLRHPDVASDGCRPGTWLAKQNERWSTLTPEQQQALAELPGFAHDAREAHFDEMIDAYGRARAAGLLPLLDRDATFDGYPVGQWLQDLLRGRDSVTPEREAKLRAAGILSAAVGAPARLAPGGQRLDPDPA